jgi:hypothetical protein
VVQLLNGLAIEGFKMLPLQVRFPYIVSGLSVRTINHSGWVFGLA